MSVIGADHEMILAGVLEHIRKIVIGLARHINSIFAQNVALIDRGSATFFTPGKIMDRVRHPLRAYLDERELGARKFVRNVIENDRVKRAYDSKFEFRKTAFVEEKVVHREAAGGRVDTDRQVKTSGFFVERKEISVAQPFVPFETAYKNATRAVLLGETRFFQRFVHREKRQHSRPAKPLRGSFPDIDEPPIVTSGDGQLHFRPPGKRPQENRRVK